MGVIPAGVKAVGSVIPLVNKPMVSLGLGFVSDIIRNIAVASPIEPKRQPYKPGPTANLGLSVR